MSTLFIDGSIDLDSFVVRESFALLANTTIDESDQSRIHDEIVSIICQMKANHREVQQYVIDQLKIILSGADSSNIRGVFESLAQLRNVIVGQPINMLAVRELNTNISKALAGAISLCASKEIRSMQSSRYVLCNGYILLALNR